MKKNSLFNFHFFLLDLIVIIPGLILAIFTIVDERQREEAAIQNNAISMANIISVQGQDLMEAARNLLVILSKVPKTGTYKTQEYSRYLAKLLVDFARYSNIGVADTNGNIIASAIPITKHVNIADRTYFRTAIETGDFAVGEYQVGRITGQPSINLGYPIVSESGRKIGVVFAVLSLEKLGSLESRVGVQLPEGWKIYKINQSGILLAQYPCGTGIIGLPVYELSHFLNKLTKGQGVVWANDSKGIPHLYAYSQIESRLFPSGISVVLSVSEELVLRDINHLFYRNLILLSIVGFIILLISSVTNELYLVHGLNAIRNATFQLAGGNLHARVKQTRGHVDVKDLGKTFNEMVGKLEQRDYDLREGKEALRKSVELYKMTFENTGTATVLIEEDTTMSLVNSKFEKLSGYSKDEIEGKKKWTEFIVKEDLNHFAALHKLRRESVEAVEKPYEFRFIDRSGTLHNIFLFINIIKGTKTCIASLMDIAPYKRMEEELRFRNVILSTQQEASIDGLLVVDEDNNIVSYNRRFVQMWNVPIELIEKKADEPVLMFVADKVADSQSFLVRVEYLYKNKRESSQEEIFLKNGMIFERFSAPMIGPDNRYYGRVWYFHDITECKQLAESLKKQKDELELIFNLVPALILYKDIHNNIIRVNSRVCSDIGMTNDKIEGRSAEDLFPVFAKQYFEDDLKVINSGKSKLGIIEQINTSRGDISWMLTDKIPVFGKYGKVNGLIVFSLDITKQKRAEDELNKYKDHLLEMVEERTRELEQSRETFRALTENTKDIIARVNNNFQFLYANAATEDVLGIPVKENIGKTLSELGFPNYLTEGFERLLKKVFKTKQNHHVEFQYPNGIWADLLAIPEFDMDGNVCSIITSARDITEFKKIQLDIESTLEKEKELNNLKSRFISVASHEFRTPLTTIYSSTELLERYGRSWDETKYYDQISRIKENIKYMTRIMEDVLVISHADSGKLLFEPEKTNLKTLCQSIVNDIELIMSDTHKLKYSYSPEEDIFMMDEKLIKYILLNLLSNAVKYSPNGGNIIFNVKKIGNDVIFLITDEGIGIPLKDQKDIFESFHRGVNVGNIKGTGLGMSIIKKSVDLHGGEIYIESEEGNGTKIKVKIPLRQNE
jgi:PAS domain S-box-containing protein